MLAERAPQGRELELPTTDGGLLTLSRSPTLHLHYRSDEELRVFGLAVHSDYRADRDYAHILEHLVMRQEVAGSELPRALELSSSTRWWSAYTSSRCISFEVSGYTPRCLERSAGLLCQALFDMRVTPEHYRSESDTETGRLTTEEQAHEGNLRMRLLVDLSNRLLGTRFSYQSAIPALENIQAWHGDRVHPDTVLWFTSGPQSFADASATVARLRARWDGARAAPRTPWQPPAMDLAATPAASRYPGPVLAWEGPAPLHEVEDYALLKTLHVAALRHGGLHEGIQTQLGSRLFPQTSSVFGDLPVSFVTLGLRQALMERATAGSTLAALLRDVAGRDAEVAREVLDSWLVRKLKYYPGRRPKGSRMFAELRESVLEDGELFYLARPELLAGAVLERIRTDACRTLIDRTYTEDALCLV